jgi:hypothetical protein
MTRDDVERITENVLRNLRLELQGGDYYDPNSRTIVLKYNETIIDSVSFDVKEQVEYRD